MQGRGVGELARESAHDFVGRRDRDCEVCGRPDRDAIHAPPPLVTYTFMVFGLYAVTTTERSLGDAVVKLGQWIDEKDLKPPAAGSWDIRVQAPDLGYG